MSRVARVGETGRTSDFELLRAAIFDASVNQNEKRLRALLLNNLNVILAALDRAEAGDLHAETETNGIGD